ncbi:alkene reductase [Acaricomes phytoseiuli]|uniref:alkene reductase n=1 Tax=Acaricomes phytoseiuli TaxID=291968 RepID=UPI00036588FE|nr:alkene reductase [Acaricomes phytoseiuli]MCW1249776.1 alkene reductase [Acaricomes phytoseiuli]
MATWQDPIQLGETELKNRLAMAPMTRNRATREGVPTTLMVEYYRQRATMGLLITEGTQPSAEGQGYMLTPGIYTDAQIKGWSEVAEAVHQEGSALVIQIMHAGRVSHPGNTLGETIPVAPSAVDPGMTMYTTSGKFDIPTPRALALQELPSVIDEFRQAARAAIEAGADGVELHSANGYLLHQFLSINTNQREDGYGGDVQGRARFVLEVARAVVEEIGADRVGIRLSPNNGAGNTEEGPDYGKTYQYLVKELNDLGLAYLHLMHIGDDELLHWIRQNWSRVLIVNRPGTQADAIGTLISEGLADMESVGQQVLANPDFIFRLRSGLDFNEADPATFYGGAETGYTDYPVAEPAAS